MNTEEIKTEKKIILQFDQREFEHAKAMFKEKDALITAIQLVAKNELDLTIEVTDSLTLKENIYLAVETRYKKQNTLNLAGEKLVELMQINLKPIYDAGRLLKGYDLVNLQHVPSKEDFSISVDNERENERYNVAIQAIEVIKKSRTLTNDQRHLNNYLLAFGSVLRLNLSTNELEPLPSFVKGN
jgi:hypothetical protein